MTRGPGCRRARSGLTLATLVAGISVSAIVLSWTVPLYIASQKAADRGVRRALAVERSRAVFAALGSDVRSARRVESLGAEGLRVVGNGGTTVWRIGSGQVVREASQSGVTRVASYSLGYASARFEVQSPHVTLLLREPLDGRGVGAEWRVAHRSTGRGEP